MPETPDPAELATSFAFLIQRFMGHQPDALAQLREQIEREREAGKLMLERAEAQLLALNQFEELIAAGHAGSDEADVPRFPAPPLKTAILRVLNDDPHAAWHRDQLFDEVVRRGWGPGGANPRNTFTARLRDLELAGLVRRLDRHHFTSVKNEGALAM